MRTIILYIILALGTFTWGTYASDTNSAPNISMGKVQPTFKVLGGVNRPGQYGLTNGMTLLDGINAAGGVAPTASTRIAVRHSDGNREAFSRPLLEATNQPPGLRAGDTVVVFMKPKESSAPGAP